MNNPYFSIVVPVYNTEKYLPELIHSVCTQTFEDWELILVDDGSTDQSGKICDQSAERDRRIRVFHTPNQGGLEARYEGVKQSTGKYMIVIDADDILVRDCLQKVKSAFEETDSDMIIWGFRMFGNESGEVRFSLPANHVYSQKEIMYTSIMDTMHSLCIRAVPVEIMKESSICPLGKLCINTDYAMLIPILRRIRNAYVMDDILYEYRVYGNSISHSVSMDKIVDTDRVTMYALSELQNSDAFGSSIEKAIFVSYLKMICGRIRLLFSRGELNLNQCRMIHELPAYSKAGRYGTRKVLGARMLFLMKCFRYSFYMPFYILRFAWSVDSYIRRTLKK